MGAAMAEEKRAHAMMFPFPCSGHINPTLKLAELLHSRGVHVTFVNTEHNHERLLRTGGALRGRDGFRFESVPDGLDDADRAAPTRRFVRTVEPNGFGLRVEEEEANSCARAQGLILNTFDELEPDVLSALRAEFPRVYTIGPLAAAMHRRVDHGASGLSLWEEDAACMAWLDAQPAAGSVLYVSFGSLAQPAVPSGSCPGLVAGDRGMDALPADFLAETKGRRFIAEWCAQEQVLRHRAVGGFLTHSGWNSTTESILSGVLMICAPGFADQYINSRYQLRREQVAAHIEELAGGGEKGEEMRRCAAEWKARAEAATAPGGSAYENLDKLVEELRPEVPNGAKLAVATHAR
ncbi:hypothetical protein ZWY2020_034640 [Hordeum vulgare]|nr:hypothetical protein ZWY2020_034640 [Hordeum vulgare]